MIVEVTLHHEDSDHRVKMLCKIHTERQEYQEFLVALQALWDSQGKKGQFPMGPRYPMLG